MEYYPMNNIRINFENMLSGYTFRYIQYEDNMWCVINNNYTVKDKAIFQSEDIRTCIEFMYMYLKYNNDDDDCKGELFLTIYFDSYNKRSEIPIRLEYDKITTAEKIKDILFKFVDEWNKKEKLKIII